MVSHELSKPRRIELILRQIDALPTLPAVATRLLALTSDDDSSGKEVTQLIQSDPSLTAKVLSLCKTADKGVRSDVLTIDRAVVLLGFNAIRNAVLSVKVMEVFGGTVDGDLDSPMAGGRLSRDPQADATDPAPGMDRRGFWMHSLAVAIAAEQIAKAHRDPELPADEAFVCGLLHDMGKLALDHVLPRSYARVVELSEINRGDIAEVERKVVGLDHHTAGKRLAEQWNLPLRLQDSIWLHGSPFDTLPKVEHRRLVGLVKLADAVVRDRHVGYSGNYRPAGVRRTHRKTRARTRQGPAVHHRPVCPARRARPGAGDPRRPVARIGARLDPAGQPGAEPGQRGARTPVPHRGRADTDPRNPQRLQRLDGPGPVGAGRDGRRGRVGPRAAGRRFLRRHLPDPPRRHPRRRRRAPARRVLAGQPVQQAGRARRRPLPRHPAAHPRHRRARRVAFDRRRADGCAALDRRLPGRGRRPARRQDAAAAVWVGHGGDHAARPPEPAGVEPAGPAGRDLGQRHRRRLPSTRGPAASAKNSHRPTPRSTRRRTSSCTPNRWPASARWPPARPTR